MTYGNDLLIDPIFDMKLFERMENEMIIGLGVDDDELTELLVTIREDYEFCFVNNWGIKLKRVCYSCVMFEL